MSDDFDKEAEKEKLRRKIEREEEAREATEHMSDLLLKGATMTNKHCGECSDPIFRYQGQEFCPTCGNELGPVDAQEGADTGDADATGEGRNREGADVEEEVPDPGDGGAAVPDGPEELGVEVPQPSGGNEPASGAGANTTPRSPAGGDRRHTGSSGQSGTPAPAAGGGDLAEARASLVRTVTRLAREAESADDVRRVRDLLAAAREAAEAIEAVDSAGR